VDATNIYAYKNLEIDVEINQDYIEVSRVVYLPTFERIEIADKKLNNTSNLVQEYIRDKYRKEFSPFANIAVELLSTGEKPFVLGLENHFGFSQEAHQYIEIRLIVKADKATHIPSIEKPSLIAREVHAIVNKELAAK